VTSLAILPVAAAGLLGWILEVLLLLLEEEEEV
jgi:hypothetical protein